jgi:hypothetical protein
MATSVIKPIRYDNPVAYIEHVTGKTVRSFKQELGRFGYVALFTDDTYCFIDDGGYFDWRNIEYRPASDLKSFCASCGGDSHVSSFDWRGWCNHKVAQFWRRARKVYWHRYTANGTAV